MKTQNTTPAAVESMRKMSGVQQVTSQIQALRKGAKIEYKEGFSPPKK